MSHRNSHGKIDHTDSDRATDFLYRVSIKCLVLNDAGKVLVVKEKGRTWWDLPGGGMDHGENIKEAISREMFEEVHMTGDFTHQVVSVDDPTFLGDHSFWQIRLIFRIVPDTHSFSVGPDADEVEFTDPAVFEHSSIEAERRIYRYATTSSIPRL